MLTKTTMKGLKTYFTIHHLIKAGPYKWDTNSNGIGAVASKLDWLHLIIISIWFVIRVTRLPYDVFVFAINGAPLTKIASSLVLVVLYISVLFYQVNTYFHIGQLQQLFNCLLAFNRKTAIVLFHTEFPLKKDGVGRFLWTMISISFLMPSVAVFSVYRRDPLHSRFFYRFITQNPEKSLLFYIYGVLEFVTNLLIWYPWIFMLLCVWLYTKSVTFWLKQLRYGANEELKHRPKEVIKIFQQLQIINLQFNDCFNAFGMPIFVMQNILVHCVILFVTLRFHDVLPRGILAVYIFWSFGLLFYLEGVTFTKLGNVSYYSGQVLGSWTEVLDVKSRKKLKAMPSLGVKVGSIYVVKRTTVLSVFLVIINLTVQALLMT